ncbi:MAG TPA: SOS response-associated peptidase [Streptosporangiaceae bacterium]|nr:SOS response-associated peptidase [Streptosporangiaceae bacterium]
MCGRYASARKRQELLAEFHIERDRVEEDLEPDYNVAPTKPVYAVLTRAPRGDHGTGEAAHAGDGSARPAAETPQVAGEGHDASTAAHEGGRAARELRVLRWGLVPSWAKDPSIGSRLINARAETVDSKPAFRRAFTKRRCLLPADGFYEWEQVESDGKTRKQPYFIHRADGGSLAFAGLYELWRDRSRPDDDRDAWLWTAVIITTRAADEVGQIHDRMPMVIEPTTWDDWLDPANTDPSHLHHLLVPAAASGLTSYPVSTEVNSVRNNGAQLIQPIPPAERDGVLAGGPGRDGDRAGQPAAPLKLL